MVKGTFARLLVLLLGLWVALAPAVYTMPAAAMTLEMSQPESDGTEGCCPDADAGNTLCAQMCLNAALVATTVERAVLVAMWQQGHEPKPYPVLASRIATPDPAPPKSVSLI